MGKKRQMKNPILEHVNLFAKGLIVTVGIFVLTIFISGFYEKYLLNIMPVCDYMDFCSIYNTLAVHRLNHNTYEINQIYY